MNEKKSSYKLYIKLNEEEKLMKSSSFKLTIDVGSEL